MNIVKKVKKKSYGRKKRMPEWRAAAVRPKSAYQRVWTELRATSELIDGVIESSDGKKYQIHRVVLAAASQYFRALFRNPLTSNVTLLQVPFPSMIVDCIVDFCYMGKCGLTPENVADILPAADHLGVLDLIELCCKYMKAHITTENALGTFSFAQIYFCKGLARFALTFILANFREIFLGSSEFLQLSWPELRALLVSDRLNISGEEMGFYAMDRWIKHDVENRQVYANELLGSLRLGRLPREFFRTKVLTSPYINNVSSTLLWMARSAMEINESQCGCHPMLDYSRLCKPRIPFEVLFVIGGWSAGSPTNSMETYDVRANKWFLCPNTDSVARSYHGLVCIDRCIYMIGGFDGATHFNTVRCFNPVTKRWTDRACMYSVRCYVSCVAIGRDIYAIGGYNGQVRMKTVERCCIDTNQWEMIPPMNRHRSDAGAVAVRNKIFVAGGFNGQHMLTSSEMYDVEAKSWIRLPHMNTPRSGVSLVYYRNYVYAIGGFNGNSRLNTVERINPENPTAWTDDVPPMGCARSNFACAVIEDGLYVIGGFNGSTMTDIVECYDGERWVEVSPMNLKRSALAVCVCPGLPNASSYTSNGARNFDFQARGDVSDPRERDETAGAIFL